MRRLAFLLLGLAALAVSADEAPPKVRVLLLSGQNNHDWRHTTPVLRDMLAATGRFAVTIAERPDQLTAASFADCDVILSNWNDFGAGKGAVTDWPAPVKTAYVEAVRGGKGHVVVHAGSASFPDWDDYQKICLATWGKGTNHGPIHEFEVRMEPLDHPVTKGMAGFKTRDELWNHPAARPEATVLASSFSAQGTGGADTWEPTALAGVFGQGRCFTLLLGHDASGMGRAEFQRLLARGVEWAATGKVTVP